jgi:hypothetical protein
MGTILISNIVKPPIKLERQQKKITRISSTEKQFRIYFVNSLLLLRRH